MQQTLSTKKFLFGLLSLCLIYIGFEFFLNAYTMLGVDEFWFAHRAFQYKDQFPYRDFAPYKTVLGYYFLLIPMLFSHNIIETLITIKNFLALLNACVIFFSGWWLTKFFSRTGILIAFTMMIISDIMLSYSTNIRVDLLAYWFCLFAVLFLLENRLLLAGLLLGLGFITSQKAIWYVFASECTLIVQYLFASYKNPEHIRFISKKTIGNFIRFNLMIAAVIICYLLFWTAMSDWQTVMHSVFIEARIMYQLDWYDDARKLFWTTILLYNPLPFLLSPLILMSLCVTYPDDRHYQQRVLIITFAFIILFCLIPYKQIFPYYTQVTLPIFLILYAAFFSWLLNIFKKNQAIIILVGRNKLWLGLAFHMAAIIYILFEFSLPKIYAIICIIPLLLGFHVTNHEKPSVEKMKKDSFLLLCISLAFVGGIYPLTLFTYKLINLNGAYQKAHILTMESLLTDGSDYLAGIELLYNKNQPIQGMRHLMGPAIDYLYQPTDKLRPVMLASLYEDPNATINSVITDLKKSSVKFYVNNYRMYNLPKKIKDYLATEYTHWWGSIYFYAPLISAGNQKIILKFSGNYMIDSDKQTKIQLDNKTYASHHIIYLPKGEHTTSSTSYFRLKLIPNELLFIDPRFYKEEIYQILF